MQVSGLLFYGGLVVLGLSLLLAVILIFSFTIAKIRLNIRLEKAYGESGEN